MHIINMMVHVRVITTGSESCKKHGESHLPIYAVKLKFSSWLLSISTTETTMTQLDCVCGRSFIRDSAFTNHQRTCQTSKKRLASALEKAKQLWKGPYKRRRVGSLSFANETLQATAGLVPHPAEPEAPAIEVRSS